MRVSEFEMNWSPTRYLPRGTNGGKGGMPRGANGGKEGMLSLLACAYELWLVAIK